MREPEVSQETAFGREQLWVVGSVCGCCCCHTVPLCFPPAADVLKSSERSKFSHTLYCHSRKTTPARPGSKLLQQLPTPHLHRPPPPTATAVKGRDPTQNLEAGSQWLFLFCTAITEHQIIHCCSFVWVSGSQGFYASCRHAPQCWPQQLLPLFSISEEVCQNMEHLSICPTLCEGSQNSARC